MHDDKRNLDSIPVGSLGIIPLESCRELGQAVDKYLVKWRCVREHEHENDITFRGYMQDSYIVSASCPRFGSGGTWRMPDSESVAVRILPLAEGWIRFRIPGSVTAWKPESRADP